MAKTKALSPPVWGIHLHKQQHTQYISVYHTNREVQSSTVTFPIDWTNRRLVGFQVPKGLKLRDTESVHCLYHSEVAYNANHWPGDWWPVSMKIHTSHLWTFSWPDQAASYREPCWPCAMFSPAMPWQSPCTVRISYMCVHLFMYSVIYIYIYMILYVCKTYIHTICIYIYIYIYSISWLCHLAALLSYATRYQPGPVAQADSRNDPSCHKLCVWK